MGSESSPGDDQGDCGKQIGQEVYIRMALEKILLQKWKFGLGETADCLENGREVSVPHTWNVEPETEEYWGTGWYGCTICPPKDWRGKRIRVIFRGVYHDARVFLNGIQVGSHSGSGYTPFSAELTQNLRCGEENWLTVRVNNEFTDQILPCNRSFDWANDGGMIRPVELEVTGESFLKNLNVTARPVITVRDGRQEEGCAVFGLQAQADAPEDGLFLEWELFEGCDFGKRLVQKGTGCLMAGENRQASVEIPNRVIDGIRFWHFDSPSLYTVRLILKRTSETGENLEDEKELVFGFRDFHVQGHRFYLNGEPVRLCGTEWMPGSDPLYGMAEPKEQLEKMLKCLKESNCVLTRFHWQQDEWVFDWCDRHGMLVQEEVPFWGKDPQIAERRQWEVFRQQAEEMITAHRNHPSIIAWGVGNELDGQAGETIQYIKDAVAYTHRLDPERTANYMTNTIYEDPGLDGTTDGDILMVNDYIGTWHGNKDQYGEWDRITVVNPDKPIVPSEFGLCEPAWTGGDVRRTAVFREKMECYRHYPNVAGTINFCLNDYRTQMGEDGAGKLRKRVHGSTGLCGEPKPSYWVVQEECSPLEVYWSQDEIRLFCRRDLPCYMVKGYFIQVLDKDGNELEALPISQMCPGENQVIRNTRLMGAGKIIIYRPNGDKVCEKNFQE